jgi:membrane-associated protein
MIETLLDFIFHIDIYLAALIQDYGSLVYLLLFLIIFLETGFVITPFLPGDSMIFVAGTFAAVGALNVYLLFLLLAAAAILGDTVNYWIGRYLGVRVFSRFIRRENMEKTKTFFANHGKETIVLARFIPVVRTFAPFVAGIGKMHYPAFLSYNVFGGIFWVALFVFSGYYLGNIPFVRDNLGIIIILIMLTSFIPAIAEYAKNRIKNTKKQK